MGEQTLTDSQAEYRYDSVPYPSRPQGVVHPEPLAIISTLFGGIPQDIENARVLELGCADGSNSIAIANYLPYTTVHGIDISAEAIRRGCHVIDELSLTNVTLEVADLRTYEVEDAYDYVLCHGLWSWVEEETQSAILRLMRRALKPEGVGLISYNTWPGWHTLRPARDIMQLVAERTDGSASALVRAGLDFLQMSAPLISQRSQIYGGMLSHATYTMEGHSESYLFHDFLAPINRPIYFRDFVNGLGSAQLQYLGEASFEQLVPYDVPEVIAQQIEVLAPDLVTLGQFHDFVRNTAFRVSLVCPEERCISRVLGFRSMGGLHVRLVGQEQAMEEGDGTSTWDTPSGVSIVAEDEGTTRILRHLDALSGSSTQVRELISKLLDHDPDEYPELAERICARLLRLYSAGLVSMSTRPFPVHVALSSRPCINRLAAFQLDNAYAGVSTAENTFVELDRFERALLLLCDGQRSHDELIHALCTLVAEDALEVTLDGSKTHDSRLIHEVIEAALPSKLEQLARLGLLS